MLRLHSIDEVRALVRSKRAKGKGIGFVPTMGALHKGHLSLVNQAKGLAESVLVSIFVNPLQFNDKADFEAYSIDIEKDARELEKLEIDALFMPSPSVIYPPEHKTRVCVSELSAILEGTSRPGHFEGVTTVVSILFGIVQPDIAVFGEKDFQQLRIIEQMVRDLELPIKIVRGKLVREEDGLAMSSRNARLSADGRKIAASISRGLFSAKSGFQSGERRGVELVKIARTEMENGGFVVDYVQLVKEESLESVDTAGAGTRMLAAGVVDGVRLIDNVGFD